MPIQNEQDEVEAVPLAVQNMHVFLLTYSDLATNWKHFKRVGEPRDSYRIKAEKYTTQMCYIPHLCRI